ncbi:radical SAM family heme chaperone HemW [Desulfotomaculum defluvii]
MITELLRRIILGKKERFLFKGYQNGLVDFNSIDRETGIYIHIPFCQTICPYCPYNKIIYDKNKALAYKEALIQELSLYKEYLVNKNISSVYIGGGTPTLLLSELIEIIQFIRDNFNFKGDIGIEVHPNEANAEVFSTLVDIGINLISLGVQTFNNQALKNIGRNYSALDIEHALSLIKDYNFKCVDIDIMTNLPGQTIEDIKYDLEKIYSYDIDQLSIYPMIIFPMTKIGKDIKQKSISRFSEFQERYILKVIDETSQNYGYHRTSVWTYGKSHHNRYTSVTRESFVGFGAGATSLYGDYFYLNTFDVDEYINAVKHQRIPINLVNVMNEREKMIFWIFWRCYEGTIDMQRFHELFDKDLDKEFKLLINLLKLLRITKKQGTEIKLTDWGRFAYHYTEKQYSIHYLNHLWENSMKQPWIKEIQI